MFDDPRNFLLLALWLGIAGLVACWLVYARRTRASRPADDTSAVRPPHLLLGFVTNFFDTFGIGSFAPTTSVFRAFRMVPDERIPGTLNVGHTLPTVLQALLFIKAIEVEFTTLLPMIAAAVAGATVGAPIVARMSRRSIQVGMGVALIIAAALFVASNLGWVATGGEALGLAGPKLWFALAGNFVLGALMTLGIGFYAPSLIMISLLGMNPKAAFPIMMGGCAFLMIAAAIRFLQTGAYRQRPALALTLGGLPGVAVAFFIVKSLDIVAVRWVIAAVVLYTAIGMLRAAFEGRRVERVRVEPA